MLTAHFQTLEGQRTTCQTEAGISLMQLAMIHGVDGILAECGGSMACGTCHVYLDPAQLHLFPPPTADEQAMLELVAAPRRRESRLSCQLVLADRHEGLLVHLPDRQT